jgi:hypothetical protein
MDAQAAESLGGAMSALPVGYQHLLDRAIDVLGADPRVEAMWVHGSVARGDADALSDLDVIVAVADDDLTGFGDEWRARLDAITPTVMARRFPGPGGSLLSITPGCLRLDMWIEGAADVPTSVVRDRRMVFDHAALDARVPPPLPPAEPSDAKFAALREWDAACRAVAQVADPLLDIEVVHTLRWILYEAYVETNRPLPTSGLKQWSAKLTPAQHAMLATLPTRGDPEAIIGALDDVLGAPAGPLPEPDLSRVIVPPEGVIRALALLDEPADARARHVAEEFFALHLYLTLVVYREDWLLGIEGIATLRKLLYELDLEENGRRPATSPDDWSGRLTAEQRVELLELPTGAATRDAVVDGHRAVRDALIARGRRVLGDSWPQSLEVAVVSHVDAFLARESARPV